MKKSYIIECKTDESTVIIIRNNFDLSHQKQETQDEFKVKKITYLIVIYTTDVRKYKVNESCD